MSLQKPLLPDCFLYWTDPADVNGDEALRIASWRRSLTLMGKSFREFETEVLPLLKGDLLVGEICQRVAHVFRAEQVIAALDTLAAQGILVEGDNMAAQNAPLDLTAQLGWLAESASGGRAAQKSLTDAHVVLFGAGAHGAATARCLVAGGLGRLTLVDPANVTSGDRYFSGFYRSGDIGKNRAEVLAAALSGDHNCTAMQTHTERPANADVLKPLIQEASLVICCLDAGEMSLTLMLNAACRGMKINWIAASLEGTEIVVGPGFFHSAGAPCYMCWRMREIAGAGNPHGRLAVELQLGRLQADLSGRRENLAASADIAGGMLSAEAFTFLTATCLPNLDGRFLTVAVPGLHVAKHNVLRKPDCPVCSLQIGAGS